jgi:hypothetical protein
MGEVEESAFAKIEVRVAPSRIVAPRGFKHGRAHCL